jgi:hypothetical protein
MVASFRDPETPVSADSSPEVSLVIQIVNVARRARKLFLTLAQRVLAGSSGRVAPREFPSAKRRIKIRSGSVLVSPAPYPMWR